jgi:hypothetical protein
MKVTFAIPIGTGEVFTQARSIFAQLRQYVERTQTPVGGPLGVALLSLAAQNARLIGIDRDQFLAMAERLYENAPDGLRVETLPKEEAQ